jgi:hypothetical protein
VNDLARRWLRRIALGLPLVASGCACEGPCPNPRTEIIPFVVADGGTPTCAEHCRAHASAVGVSSVLSCTFVTTDAGAPAVDCTYMQICGGGRRPEGYAATAVPAPGVVAAWLAELAQLEAASVGAFTDLARELDAHAAPHALARGARRAARDEVRHASLIGSLARAAGACPPGVTHRSRPVRPLGDVAHDDAVEGCAREALGALVAAHQAEHARDPMVRSVFRGVARDEAFHALLSAAVLDWTRDRVGGRRARAIDDARRAELDSLATSSDDEVAPVLRSVLGLPSSETMQRYVRALA